MESILIAFCTIGIVFVLGDIHSALKEIIEILKEIKETLNKQH